MVSAAGALIAANSPLSAAYFDAMSFHLGWLSVSEWISEGLMAVFFLLVGLVIKHEMLEGLLQTWSRRALPGLAALGGMIVPAIIYAAINRQNAIALRGWAIPRATDIAFAVAVLLLLGSRIPASLKVFPTTLAVIDDLGAVLIIALFYAGHLFLINLMAAGVILVFLFMQNLRGVMSPWPYLALGIVLWIFVYRSGVHSTVSGVLLALAIPVRVPSDRPGATAPSRCLERALNRVVPFVVLPLFGFANAGVSFHGIGPRITPVAIGVAAGLVLGKVAGVFGSALVAIRLRPTELPIEASWLQFFGVALLCGIGFTMSLLIGLLSFPGRENSPERSQVEHNDQFGRCGDYGIHRSAMHAGARAT
jgi:NhaA family Na+:H+ antiporter